MKITFFGASQEVTGSKYLLEQQETKLLVDCGLFQGGYKTAKRNWDEFPIDAASIKAVVLTHAHIDHSGYIPLLIKNGFRGKIYCTQATYELCEILLIDNGHLQEEAANRANKYKDLNDPIRTPLYTQADAEYALSFFHVVDYDVLIKIDAFTIKLIRCSHIPGSAFVIVSDGKKTLTFSGDLGGANQLIMQAPTPLKQTDYLVLESTYGDRIHEKDDPIKILGELINKAVARGGSVLIPAFAVGRTQTILYCLYQLKQKNAIPDIPIFLDSPMAIKVTKLFCKFSEDHTLSTRCKDILYVATYTPTVDDSKELDSLQGSAIIVAGSGMVEGGRMLHHFQKYITDPKNIIVLVGFQAYGTRGHDLEMGTKEINLYGKMFEVHAQIETVDLFSAHADSNEILEWLKHFQQVPKKVFLTHGELESAQALKKKIEERFGWTVIIPQYQDSFELD
jgi:metallo-beta-lactamase family protein